MSAPANCKFNPLKDILGTPDPIERGAKALEMTRYDLVAFFYTCLPHYTQFKVDGVEHRSTPSPAHYIISDIILKDTNSMVLALPRELGKSSYLSPGLMLHNVIFTKYRYIIYVGNSQSKANEALSNMLREIIDYDGDGELSNTVFRPFIKSVHYHLPEKSVGTIVITKTDGSTIVVKSVGRGVNTRGIRRGQYRPDLIICDDIEDANKARNNAGYRQRTIEWFSSDIQPLGQGAKLILCGTKIHEDSLITVYAEDPPVQVLPGQGPVPYKVIDLGYRDSSKKGTIWAAKYTDEGLKALEEDFKKHNIHEVFLNEYLNKVGKDEANIFDKEPIMKNSYSAPTQAMDIIYDKTWNPIISRWNKYVYSDLASQTVQLTASAVKPVNCLTSIVSFGIDSSGTWFVHEIEAGVWDPDTKIEMTLKTMANWNPICYYIEKGTLFNELYPQLLHRSQETGQMMSPMDTVSTATSFDGKFERIIGSLKEPYNLDKIKVNRDARGYGLILEEFDKGRRSSHIDILDALAMARTTARIPEVFQQSYGTITDNYIQQPSEFVAKRWVP